MSASTTAFKELAFAFARMKRPFPQYDDFESARNAVINARKHIRHIGDTSPKFVEMSRDLVEVHSMLNQAIKQIDHEMHPTDINEFRYPIAAQLKPWVVYMMNYSRGQKAGTKAAYRSAVKGETQVWLGHLRSMQSTLQGLYKRALADKSPAAMRATAYDIRTAIRRFLTHGNGVLRQRRDLGVVQGLAEAAIDHCNRAMQDKSADFNTIKSHVEQALASMNMAHLTLKRIVATTGEDALQNSRRG